VSAVRRTATNFVSRAIKVETAARRESAQSADFRAAQGLKRVWRRQFVVCGLVP
jgi:hypothetical protein